MAGLENQTVITPEVKVAAPKPNIMQTARPIEPKVEAAPVETAKTEIPAVTYADIQKRAAESTPSTVEKTAPVPEDGMAQVSYDDIKDPAARAIIEKKVKDLESGYNKKYQTVAQLRKEAEDLKFKYSNWTPQRLAEELRKPEFVQAMQTLQQTAPPSNFEGNVEEWSGLNENEKSRILANERETKNLQFQLAQMKQKEEDVEIKKVFPDFESQVVDEAIEGLRSGNITASRLDIFKVVNYDKHVETSATNGYKFGYEDGLKKGLEKSNGSTHLNGNLNVTPADQVPEEVRKGGFSSIAMWRLGRLKNGSSQKR